MGILLSGVIDAATFGVRLLGSESSPWQHLSGQQLWGSKHTAALHKQLHSSALVHWYRTVPAISFARQI